MGKYQSERQNVNRNIVEIWVTEEEDPESRRLAFRINKRTKTIMFYPKENDFFLSEVTLDGFENLPDDFSNNGYIKQGVQYYLNKKLETKSIASLEISKDKTTTIRKVRNQEAYNLTLKYDDFKILREQFLVVNNQSSQSKNDILDGFFYNHFPDKFEESTSTAQQQYRNVIRNLNSDIIEHFTPDDLNKMEGFIADLLDKRYQSNSHKFLQLARTKIKVDTIAIDRILAEFQKNLEDGISENLWGKYLKKNLFLLDSKYVKILPELNVILRGSRNVDFGMIDTKGYLDIFEIKKPDTPLLAADTDRGNYYWHTSTVKAIVQAEKYLFNAERKASNLAEDISREERISVKVVKPRAILITGHSDQLDSDEKRDDFKVLRQSLKNIDIILYDELLEGLENQKNKYYDQITEN
ncbi:Shedu immune nuclease family protein [Cyclobacterium roseum]|uniref:Shedu immune nuclease family protein n=1 Tax=Cyclobacterium roseum TaxID=2666137 RepID=UPI0013913168|nr:Shedu immune nuclease family protein [Cyclobacterium roseum]